MASPGQNSGQPSWDVYIDALVRDHGSLAAVAARLAEMGAWREDVESIARALRRLRTRGTLSGGRWGSRLVATFGLSKSVDARLRFMGSYHSRFVDLPVPLCADLVQMWDRPPTSESRIGRLWLSLARATLALRTREVAEARVHLATARSVASEDVAGQIEVALGEALVASLAFAGLRPFSSPRLSSELQTSKSLGRPAPLDEVPGLLARLGTSEEADCLRARHVGQVTHALNRLGETERAEALLRALPDEATTAPFARSRRANGIAYARFRHRDLAAACREAWLAVRYAGDAGHVRLRAMGLLMVARVAPSAEAHSALERAREIGRALEDETLLARCRASERARR